MPIICIHVCVASVSKDGIAKKDGSKGNFDFLKAYAKPGGHVFNLLKRTVIFV